MKQRQKEREGSGLSTFGIADDTVDDSPIFGVTCVFSA